MSSSRFYLFIILLFVSMLLLPLGILLTDSYSPPEQHVLCNARERSALLQFKKSFVIDKSASLHPLAYPKVLTWDLRDDCCSWDGVYCDEEGHAIGLDLSSSCLFGSVYSNSSLFKLKHLQGLILADNHFNYSPIPPELALLSTTLTHLNLSRSYFAGQIPSEISMLSRLTVLDLGLNYDPSSSTRYLQLKQPVFTSLVQNMSNLILLALSWVDISSTVPIMLSNLSSLSFLYMRSCNLVGEFPSSVFLLPDIQYISIRYNDELTGHLPQFNRSSLQLLMLSNTSFSGPISSSLGLDNLEVLFLSSCQLSSQIPFLIQNLTKLARLDLGYNTLRGSLPTPPPSIIYYIVSHNRLAGEIPPLFCNFSSLSYLELNHNNLSGELPRCLGNMSNLSLLTVNNNNFHGTIPPMCSNGTNILESLNFAENQLQGKLPTSLANCAMLRNLNVGHNEINDTFPFWMGKLDDLQLLILRSNKFHGPIESYASANDTEFPNLRIIDLSRNGFFGHLPSALFHKWKSMKKSSTQIDFTYMHLNRSFSILLVEETTAYSAFSMILANKGNELKYGKIPNEFAAVDFSSNTFTGEIPMSIGNLNGLYMLNLSNNYLTGPIVPSLAYLSEIESLDLSNNKLSGEIPQELAKLSFLAMLNVSHNNLTGQVPRGKQLDTFQDNSFEGNLGLCGELLINKRCKSHTPPSIAPVCLGNCEDVEPSLPAGKWDLMIITAGYAGGLIVGFVIGNTLMEKKPEWFVKVFGKMMKPQARRGTRRRRN